MRAPAARSWPLLLGLAGCAWGDAGATALDAAASDAGGGDGAGAAQDAAARDAAMAQGDAAGRLDGAVADGAGPDAASVEGGSPDAATVDGGNPDASAIDGGNPDASADAGPPSGPRFTDVTVEAGLDYRQAPTHAASGADFYAGAGLSGDAAFETGGAAAADYDGDGRVDLYVTRLGAPGILYHNRGDGSFEDVTASVGLSVSGFHSVGCGFGDIDNDGDPDLYVTTLASPRFYLFINRVSENAGFTEEAETRGAAVVDAEPRQGFSVSFGDYDRDGFLDLHTTEWQYDLLAPPTPSHSRLLHNRGGADASLAGHFEDVTAAAGVALDNASPPGDQAFASSFSDLDDDGYPDLLVASDFGTSRLFWNDGAGGFLDGTAAAGLGTDEHGMGLTVGDHDGDGLLDVFVTSIYCEGPDTGVCPRTGNRLYRGLGQRRFEDATSVAGVRDGSWGWGASFLDFDNDGDLDLAMTNGIRFVATRFQAFYLDAMRLWDNDGTGTMTERAYALGLREHGDGKGLLVLDFDGDGDQDLFWVEHVRGGRLFRNDVAGDNAWLRLRLQGRSANRQAFGARARVWIRGDEAVPLLRELRGGNNFLGQNEAVLHFGLGAGVTRVARVEITWPTPGVRKVQTLLDVASNQRLTIAEPP